MKSNLDKLIASTSRDKYREELSLGWLRYEWLRKLNPREFLDLYRRNMAGENFDAIIDAELEKSK